MAGHWQPRAFHPSHWEDHHWRQGVVVVPPEPEAEAPAAGIAWGFVTPAFHRIRRGHARIRVGVHARGRAVLRRDAKPTARVVLPGITTRARVELRSVVLAARADDEELIELGIL